MQPLLVSALCSLPLLLLAMTVCNKNSTLDHIPPSSLATQRLAHLV